MINLIMSILYTLGGGLSREILIYFVFLLVHKRSKKVGTHILRRRSRRANERTQRQILLREKGRPPKLDKKGEEDLIAENQKFRSGA